MFHPGIDGSRLEYYLLRKISGAQTWENGEHPSAYKSRGKLGVLFGPGIWPAVAGKHVIDFGCGGGKEAIEIAQHGARRVIGIDVRDDALRVAKLAAEEAGVSDRCVFATCTGEPADLILSIHRFEHYDDPEGALRAMSQLLKPDGRVLVAFGPPWFHPLGGQLFSVFPWAHVIFTERALIRWRSDFKSDGATRFCEVAGGLNQMTVRRFRKLVEKSDFSMEHFEAVPIRRLRFIANSLTREFTTSTVRCRLVLRASQRGAGC